MSFPSYIAVLCYTQMEEQWRSDLTQHQHFISEETEAQKEMNADTTMTTCKP